MDKVLKKGQINSRFGILFQIPVFLVAAFGVYKLIEMLYYSLTKFNMIEAPSFVGFQNYSNIFKDDVIGICLSNTASMVFVVAILLLFSAILPALFTARLKLPFGLGVMGAFWLVSLCAMLPNLFNMIFSGDSYGMINSILLSGGIITEPIAFKEVYTMELAIIIMWLYCLAPVFSVTYIAARMKHSFLGTAIAVCLIPVLMYSGGNIVTGVVGAPSLDYSADWLYTIFNDYLMVRYDVGFAYAILVVGLIMLSVWCLIACAIAFGAWAICKNVSSEHRVFKVLGLVTFALSMFLTIVASYYAVNYLLKAFVPLDELFTLPNGFLPKKPTFENFSNLFQMLGSKAPFSQILINSLVAIPLALTIVYYLVVLPSGVGFGLFNVSTKQRLLLLCFVPFLFVGGYLTISQLGMLDTYSAYMVKFLSSITLWTTVFVVYLAVRLVFNGQKLRAKNLIIGIFFVLTSFYAIGVIRGIWCSSNGVVYNEGLKTWREISSHIAAGGVARINIAAANDMLMILATIAVVIIPLALLLVLYLSYRKNTESLSN